LQAKESKHLRALLKRCQQFIHLGGHELRDAVAAAVAEQGRAPETKP